MCILLMVKFCQQEAKKRAIKIAATEDINQQSLISCITLCPRVFF